MYEMRVDGINALSMELHRQVRVYLNITGIMIYKLGNDIRNSAIDNIEENNQIGVSGMMKNSAVADYTTDGMTGEVGSKLLSPPYPLYQEKGTKPHFPPYKEWSSLWRWTMLKLGVPREEAEGVAFTIARAIAKNGTEAKPWLEPAYNVHAPGFEKSLLRKLKTELRKGN